MKQFHYQTPIGVLCIREEDNAITGIFLDSNVQIGEAETETKLIREAHRQLSEYFDGKRKAFELPLKTSGTEFQEKVWEGLRRIPYGETRSYGELAAMIDNPKGCRAVGGANHKNPILIVTPCHRVINADGSLGGFGAGLDVKKYLLGLEQGETH